MKFIEALRNRPIIERKIILWITVIVIGLLLGTVWVLGTSNNIKKIKSTDIQEDLNLPKLKI
ncbi:hypothetical protein KKA24_01495 [Patescibacteria group bacterium]|nr:hypothetical protein [Patescibacteria group bacterium]